jgi:predicted nucleic acid-binding protein
MPDNPSGALVVDASVAAKVYFEEAGSKAARRLLKSAPLLLAPDLLFIEMASLAVKRVRRGLATANEAFAAVSSIPAIIDHVTAMEDLSEHAFQLAVRHGFSAYDGAYLALAERSHAIMLTADIKFAQLAMAAGLADLVLPLEAD